MLIVILLNVVFTPLIRVSVRSVFQTATVQFAVNTMHSLDCRASQKCMVVLTYVRSAAVVINLVVRHARPRLQGATKMHGHVHLCQVSSCGHKP
jgi:hypothetical protein